MNNKITKMMALLLVTVSSQSWVYAGGADVGTQFTYQGELLDNGSPANGAYDLLIQLYASSNGGSPIDFVNIEDLQVDNGLINVELDYGDLPFDGDEKYLQINVRPGVSTGNLEPLIPRQRINVTPYAIQTEFTENGGSPWTEENSAISYTNKVFVGVQQTQTSGLLTVDSPLGESPFRVKINGSSKLYVLNNGGTALGANTTAPADGLRVEGDAQQSIAAHGFIKAATSIECGAGLNGGSLNYFNNVNGNDFTTTQNGAAGGCSITVPFDISNAFFTVSAHAIGGVNVFESVMASCSAFSNTQIQCQLQQIAGTTTSLSNGVVQMAIY